MVKAVLGGELLKSGVLDSVLLSILEVKLSCMYKIAITILFPPCCCDKSAQSRLDCFKGIG